MLLTGVAALIILANGSATEVGYESLLDGRNSDAVEEIRANTKLSEDDPVKLINLGIAYARQGHSKKARTMFEAAMKSQKRVVLETANGDWKDSRHLAKAALQMLDRDEFRAERVATR